MKDHPQDFLLAGIKCSSHTIPQLVDSICALRHSPASRRIVNFINAHVCNLAVRSPQLAQYLNESTIVAADGMSVVWAARCLGKALASRCNMTEAFRCFLRRNDIPPSRALLIGGTQAEADKAATVIDASSSHCRIVRAVSGFHQLDEYERVLAELPDVDIVLVGMGTPKSEALIDDLSRRFVRPVFWHIGGGTIRFYAGAVKEAPLWMRRTGLQWLHRLFLEPGRMASRYVLGNPKFIWHVVRLWWAVKVRRPSDNSTSCSSGVSVRVIAVLMWVLLAMALFFLMGNTHQPAFYGPSLASWLYTSWRDPGAESSHCWLIPIVSMWLFARKKRLLRGLHTSVDYRGLVPLLAGCLLYWIGVRAQQPRAGILGFIAGGWGAVFFLKGREIAKTLTFPFAYLVFAVPMGFLVNFTFRLRLLSCSAAVFVLNGLGLSTTRHGTTIISTVGKGFTLDVADPCSGLQSIIAMNAITALYSYLTQKTNVGKWILFLSAFPLAVVGNAVRILTIGMVAQIFGQEAAMRVYHDYSGYIVFVSATAVMMLLGSLLNKLACYYGQTSSK